MSTSTKSAPSSRQGASICCFCCSVFALRRESTSSQVTSTRGVQRSKLTEDYSGSGVCPRPGAVAIAWQQPLCVGPSCGFVKLQHTSREWLKQNTQYPRCRSRHGRIQKYRPDFATTVTVVTRPRRWATCRPTAPGATALRPPGPSADAPRDLHPFRCFYAAVQLHKCAQVVCLLADQAGDLSMAARVSPLPSSGGAAFRRRERRLRSFWKHEQYSIKMALACATHHSWQCRASVGVLTDAVLAERRHRHTLTRIRTQQSYCYSPIFPSISSVFTE